MERRGKSSGKHKAEGVGREGYEKRNERGKQKAPAVVEQRQERRRGQGRGEEGMRWRDVGRRHSHVIKVA